MLKLSRYSCQIMNKILHITNCSPSYSGKDTHILLCRCTLTLCLSQTRSSSESCWYQGSNCSDNSIQVGEVSMDVKIKATPCSDA